MPGPKIRRDLETFDPKYKYAWFDNYKADIKFDGKLSCSSAFDVYEQARTKTIDGFKDIKTPGGGLSLTEKLNAAVGTEKGAQAREAIKTALATSAADTQATRTQFSKDVTDLNKLLSEPKPRFHPGQIGGYLLDLKSKALESVNNQHAKAKADLTALFDDQTFKQNMSASGLGYNDTNLPGLKVEMLAAMDKNHKEELEKLEKSINDDANKLFQASKDNYYRLSYLGYKYNESKAMQKIINENMPTPQNPAEGTAGIVVNGDDEVLFKNVDPNKFKQFDTINHGWISTFDRKIHHTDNGFSISLDNRWNSEETILKDLTSFCDAIKACGKDKITITIRNPDEETGQYHAQLAFEAAIKAGFDPKKVTIKLGDKVVMSHDDKGELKESELFKEHGSKLSYIMGEAARIEKTVKKLLEGEDSTKKVKDALIAMQNTQTGTTQTSTTPPTNPTVNPVGGR